MKKILMFLFFLYSINILGALDSVPNSFTDDTTISASRMNQNFQTFIDAINAVVEVGTIRASVLPPDKYYGLTGNSWVLADGRIASLEYFNITGESNVPDLRGMFLRSLNMGRIDGLEDSDGTDRTRGDFQEDQFQGHWHELGTGSTGVSNSGYITSGGESQAIGDTLGPVTDGVHGTPRFSYETRPKNIAVYYYIKVK